MTCPWACTDIIGAWKTLAMTGGAQSQTCHPQVNNMMFSDKHMLQQQVCDQNWGHDEAKCAADKPIL